MKKKIIGLVLAVVFLSLLFLVYDRTKKVEVEEETAITSLENEELKVLTLEKESIKELKVSSEGTYDFKLLEDGKWSALGLEKIVLDQTFLNNLAETISTVSASEIVSEKATEEELVEFGLKTPSTVVEILEKESKVLNVGISTPAKDSYYVMVNGSEKVYLVSANVLNNFMFKATDLVDKNIVLPQIQIISNIYFKQKGNEEVEIVADKTVEVPKAEEGKEVQTLPLVMVKPLAGAKIYDAYIQESIYAKIYEMKVSEVLETSFDFSNEKYGFVDSPYVVSFSDGEVTSKFTFGKSFDDTKVYLAIDGRNELFTTDKTVLTELLKVKPFGLIERFVYITNIDTVASIEVKYSGGVISSVINPKMVKNDDGKEREEIEPEINGKRVSSDKYKTFYQSAIGISYDYMRDENFEPTGEADVTITYFKRENGEKTVVEYFNYSNEGFYVAKVDGKLQNVVAKSAVQIMLDYVNKIKDEPFVAE